MIAKQTQDGNFPGGSVTVYGLKDGGVELATTGLDDEAKAAIEEAKEAIKSGKVTVPEN